MKFNQEWMISELIEAVQAALKNLGETGAKKEVTFECEGVYFHFCATENGGLYFYGGT